MSFSIKQNKTTEIIWLFVKVDSYIHRNSKSVVLLKTLDFTRRRELISIVMRNTGV